MEHLAYGLGYAAESSGAANCVNFRASNRARILFSSLQFCVCFILILWKLAVVLAVLASSGRKGAMGWRGRWPLLFHLGA